MEGIRTFIKRSGFRSVQKSGRNCCSNERGIQADRSESRQEVAWRSWSNAGLKDRFESVRKTDQAPLGPWPGEKRQPNRQIAHVAHRHGNAGIARDRGLTCAAAKPVITVHPIDGPRRAGGRGNERVKIVLRHDLVDPIFTGQAAAGRQSFSIYRSFDPVGCFCPDQLLLAEIRHGLCRVDIVLKVDRSHNPASVRINRPLSSITM